jgi:hypothetical protein
MPVVKGFSDELEAMRFKITVKPILSNKGALKISIRYPKKLQNRPFSLLIDDQVVDNPQAERIMDEGDHHLVILSDDYRDESRIFKIERARVLELPVVLQDPTPLVIFEGPESARIFFDNKPVERPQRPLPVEPGSHEARFQLSDYSIVKQMNIQKGKTYHVALTIGINISEGN